MIHSVITHMNYWSLHFNFRSHSLHPHCSSGLYDHISNRVYTLFIFKLLLCKIFFMLQTGLFLRWWYFYHWSFILNIANKYQVAGQNVTSIYCILRTYMISQNLQETKYRIFIIKSKLWFCVFGLHSMYFLKPRFPKAFPSLAVKKQATKSMFKYCWLYQRPDTEWFRSCLFFS